jgi:hypothetical protein
MSKNSNGGPLSEPSIEERRNFSVRLKSVLIKQKRSLKPSSFVRGFNLRAEGATVTAHAARKWLIGESIPTQQRIVIIAKWLNVNAAWLRFGDGKNEGFLSAPGVREAISKDEAALIGSVVSLSKPSQQVVQGLVELLRSLEEVMIFKDEE